jgi:hypothetical protein
LVWGEPSFEEREDDEDEGKEKVQPKSWYRMHETMMFMRRAGGWVAEMRAAMVRRSITE